jgi:hypothetical protein
MTVKTLRITGQGKQKPGLISFSISNKKSTLRHDLHLAGGLLSSLSLYPYSMKQGIFSAEQGILPQEQGILSFKIEIIAGWGFRYTQVFEEVRSPTIDDLL